VVPRAKVGPLPKTCPPIAQSIVTPVRLCRNYANCPQVARILTFP
jgi:hypothetical protein